jgi:ribokinase
MDLVTRAPRLPLPGETLTGSSFGTYLGGKGLNQAVAARRMGATVAMIGKVGADDFGTRVRAALEDEAIAAAGLSVDHQQPTGAALILVEEQRGENSIVVTPGANGALTPSDVDRAADLIRGARVVLLQLEIPLATTVHAAQLAHAAGCTVVLTPAPAQPLPDALLAVTDVLLPNVVELAQIQDAEAELEPEQGARALLGRGCGAVIVTLGRQGALLVTPHATHAQPALPVTAVDTVGAGDALAGAIGALLAEGLELSAALRYACAAGALAVTKSGALPALPTRAAVEALLGAPAG